MGDLGHLRGREEPLHNQVGRGGWEEGSKSGGRMGLVLLRGGWGRGGVPTPRGAHSPLRDQRGQGDTFGGSEGNVASISPTCSGPSKPAGVPGLNLHPLGPPPVTHVLGAWEGGGSRSRGEREPVPQGAAGGGEGFPCSEGPTHGEGISGDGERTLGDQGIRGECSQHFPDLLGPRQACWVPGLNLHPPGPPPATLSLGPAAPA